MAEQQQHIGEDIVAEDDDDDIIFVGFVEAANRPVEIPAIPQRPTGMIEGHRQRQGAENGEDEVEEDVEDENEGADEDVEVEDEEAEKSVEGETGDEGVEEDVKDEVEADVEAEEVVEVKNEKEVDDVGGEVKGAEAVQERVSPRRLMDVIEQQHRQRAQNGGEVKKIVDVDNAEDDEVQVERMVMAGITTEEGGEFQPAAFIEAIALRKRCQMEENRRSEMGGDSSGQKEAKIIKIEEPDDYQDENIGNGQEEQSNPLLELAEENQEEQEMPKIEEVEKNENEDKRAEVEDQEEETNPQLAEELENREQVENGENMEINGVEQQIANKEINGAKEEAENRRNPEVAEIVKEDDVVETHGGEKENTLASENGPRKRPTNDASIGNVPAKRPKMD